LQTVFEEKLQQTNELLKREQDSRERKWKKALEMEKKQEVDLMPHINDIKVVLE